MWLPNVDFQLLLETSSCVTHKYNTSSLVCPQANSPFLQNLILFPLSPVSNFHWPSKLETLVSSLTSLCYFVYPISHKFLFIQLVECLMSAFLLWILHCRSLIFLTCFHLFNQFLLIAYYVPGTVCEYVSLCPIHQRLNKVSPVSF